MQPSPPPTDLYTGVCEIVRRPVRTLVPPWSWKAAALSAVVRSVTFFGSNLKSGAKEALRAMVVEAIFAVVTAGLIGAVSQRLRAANPAWATAALVCLGLPGVMLLTQLLVHRMAHTPHVGPGLASSFAVAAVASGFTWFAMRHGALLGGTQTRRCGRTSAVCRGLRSTLCSWYRESSSVLCSVHKKTH